MEKNRFCDLHTHSCRSDGTFTPEEVLRAAEELGLGAVALCDHNTISGAEAFLRLDSPVRAIAGVEITADCAGQEIHVVGLFIPEASFSAINGYLEQIREEKEAANYAMFRRLRQAGYDISFFRILEDGDKENLNRAHFARELLRSGYVRSVAEAFQTILSEEAGFYRPGKRRDGLDVIRFLRSQGAAPVLAHPFLNLTEAQLLEFLPKAKEQGLLGMEVAYSLFDEATTQKAAQLARQFGLLPSGGSDFHGSTKPDIQLGTGRGNLQIPLQWAQALEAAVN